MSRYWALVVAAGSGRRFGGRCPKQYCSLLGRSVLSHSLDKLLDLDVVVGGVVVLAAGDPHWAGLGYRSDKPLLTAEGGSERCHSVINGLRALRSRVVDDDWILVHDAARPCVRPGDLRRLINTLDDDPAGGLLAVPVRDTLKRVDERGRIRATEPRENLWHAQTPQMFRYGLLLEALTAALAAGRLVTDEAAAVEALGHLPRLVEGHYDNIKLTTEDDLALAEFHLLREQGA